MSDSAESIKQFCAGAYDAATASAVVAIAVLSGLAAVAAVVGFALVAPATVFDMAYPLPADASYTARVWRVIGGIVFVVAWNAFLTYPILAGVSELLEDDADA